MKSKIKSCDKLIIVRGGGDIATGTIYKLWKCGFSVLVLETLNPSSIRRFVSLSEAVYDGAAKVEDLTARRVRSLDQAWEVIQEGDVPVMVDPDCKILNEVRPYALVDAILAKKNLGTTRDMSDITIGLGPGFTAGMDVDLCVETMRGNDLGRVIEHGSPLANTNTPGVIAGYGKERVIHSPAAGVLLASHKIGDIVKKDEEIAVIAAPDGECVPVKATLSGLLRGMIRDNYPVTKGFKICDIDPRKSEYENCFRISDKARCVAGGVLEGILYLGRHLNGAVIQEEKYDLS